MTDDQLWDKLAEVSRVIEPFLAGKVAYHQNNLPDPRTQPVSYALAKAFLFRLERQLAAIRAGADAMKQELGTNPGVPIRETLEMESWFTPKRKPSLRLTQQIEDAMGNMFVSVGKMTYAEARFVIREMQRFSATHGRGAPSKRPETLKILDARIYNGWSYPELAARLCDCGATEHGEHCSERIRKRLKELELFLTKHGIQIPATTPEKNRD